MLNTLYIRAREEANFQETSSTMAIAQGQTDTDRQTDRHTDIQTSRIEPDALDLTVALLRIYYVRMYVRAYARGIIYVRT